MNYTEIGDFLGLSSETNPLMMLVWILPVILFVFYGQRIQLLVSSSEIRKQIKKLDEYRDHSMNEALSYAASLSGVTPGIDARIKLISDYFIVPPVDMDPGGLVPKVKAVVRNREKFTRQHIVTLLPKCSEIEVGRMQTLLEVAASLRLIHRIMNHLFLTAKKQNNYPLILPLQMMLPFVMEEAKAMRDAISAFRSGQPVGDGVGPVVVGTMMLNLQKTEIAHQTVSAQDTLEGRHLTLVKAAGPAPVVGRPEEALETLIRNGTIPDAIVMVDAALKLEGEESGTVSRGFGAAIGGTGAERFQIEEMAVQQQIPIFCVVVKQSIKESITLMSRPIYDSIDTASEYLHDTILENTRPGDQVLVIGVGNTGGVGQ